MNKIFYKCKYMFLVECEEGWGLWKRKERYEFHFTPDEIIRLCADDRSAIEKFEEYELFNCEKFPTWFEVIHNIEGVKYKVIKRKITPIPYNPTMDEIKSKLPVTEYIEYFSPIAKNGIRP